MSATGESNSERRPAAAARAQVAREQARRKQIQRRRLGLAAAAVAVFVAAIVGMVVVKYTGDGDDSQASVSAGYSSGDEVLDLVTALPASAFDEVGKGKTYSKLNAQSGGVAYPLRVTDQPELSRGGKPVVIYYGSELCPHCSVQRWPVLVALSRFGTLGNLGLGLPPTGETDPDKRIITFHGLTYSSEYIEFQGLELVRNLGGGKTERAKMTEEQEKTLRTLNAPPYVDEGSDGGVPFMDFANKYVIQGGTYNGSVIQNKSAKDIAQALRDPRSDVAAGVTGSANMISALLCELTKGKPEKVCTSEAVRTYAKVR